MARSGNHAVVALLTGPFLFGIYACGSVLGITDGTPREDGGVDAPVVEATTADSPPVTIDAGADSGEACVPRRKDDVCLGRCGPVTECTETDDCGGCGSGKKCSPAGTCVCAPLPLGTLCASRCGNTPDGCGGTVTCPTCAGGGCDPNCGCAAESDPQTCSSQGRQCGPTTNNCGQGVTSCGDCGTDQTCATNGVCCDTDAKTCQGKCGTVTNNCGLKNVVCSACGTGSECSNSQCCASAASLCGARQCGQVFDPVCGRSVSCGSLGGGCATGMQCDANGTCCADQGTACAGKQCGSVTNACSQTFFCASTCNASTETCVNNACCTSNCSTACGQADVCGGTCTIGVSRPCTTQNQCCSTESCRAAPFGSDAGAGSVCKPGACIPKFQSGCSTVADCCVGSSFCMIGAVPDSGTIGTCE